MTLLPSPSLDILFFIVRERDVQQNGEATETKRRGKKAKEEDTVAGTSLTSSQDLLVTAVVAVRRGSGYDDYAVSSEAKRAVRVEFCIRKH